MRKGMKLIWGVLFLIGLTACAREEQKAAPAKIPLLVRDVRVEALETATVNEGYEAVGTVRSRVTSVISARTTGSILAVHFREGDRVKAGQLLVEIDDRDAAAQLRRAQAGLREARERLPEIEGSIKAAEAARAAAEAEKSLADSTFRRFETLFARGSASRQEFEQAEARFRSRQAEARRSSELIEALAAKKEQIQARIEQAQAEVEQAQVSAGYSRILSPLQGLVITKVAEVGMLAAPGVPLLTVEDDGHYRLEAPVEESQIGKIRPGQTARVLIGESEWPGKVSEIGPSADPASRSSTVKIDLFPKKGKEISPPLRSGLFGKVFFRIGNRQVLMIPQKALIQRGQLQEVFVVDPANVARLRLVKTGKSIGDKVEILAGLQVGERIITEGLEKVQDGNRVEARGTP